MATLPTESYLQSIKSKKDKDIPNKSKSGQLHGQEGQDKSLPKGKIDLPKSKTDLPKGKIDYTNEGISLATQATEEDRKKNYIEAIQLYEKSIEFFTLALKNEKYSQTSKSNIASKSNEYSQRAEKLKAYIRNKKSSNHTNMNSGTPRKNSLNHMPNFGTPSFVPAKKNLYASENSKSDPANEGLSLAKQATEEDRKKNYVKAVELYENSVKMLNLALNKEKFSESSKSKISNMCNQYLERAAKLKAYISRKNSSNLPITTHISDGTEPDLKNSSDNSTMEENLPITNIFSCKICYESHGPQFILDCGHLPFCDNCSESIFSECEPKCPICRKKITQKIRAYF